MDILNENFDTFVMCRACMMHINPVACKPLFSDHFAELFTKCTDVKVDVSDGLPAHICLTCYQKLQLVHSFKEQCISSDLKLKEILKTNHPSVNDIYFDTEHAVKPEVKLEDDFLRDECTSTFLEQPKHQQVNVTCKSEPVEDGNRLQQKYKSKTNNDESIKDFKPRLRNRIKTEDDENYRPDSSEESDYEENIKKEKRFKRRTPKKEKPKANSHAHLCIPCGRSFVALSHLKKHLKTVNIKFLNFQHTCRICNNLFSEKAELREHKKIHSKTSSSCVCDLCGKVLLGKKLLYAHKKKHITTNPIPCKDCDKTFITNSTLKSHIERIHLGQRKLVCDVCGKAFFNQFGLNNHVRSHTQERPFECTHCKKRFHTRSYLVAHTRMHTGSRPYACDLCPKAFAHTKILKHHRMRHTGEKPHVCLVCQRAFIQRVALTTHMKTHTGTPPGDSTDKNVLDQ